MERRDFLKTFLATFLASPFLVEAKTRASTTALYLISDTPDLFLPPILAEISPCLGPRSRVFSLDPSLPAAERLLHALRRFGWAFSSLSSASIMSLSFKLLSAPAFPSFTLTRLGKIQDLRTSNLLRLWKQMNSGPAPSSLLTIASFASTAQTLRQGQRVAAYADGKRAASYPLDKDRVESFRTEGGRVVIAIESGRARVISSTCRHQVCLVTPPVCYAGERIVCAPRRFLLEVEGPRFVDTVTA